MHSGTRIGPYEIAAPIGAGGMGEVFRARDTRLNRDVAVKVLPKDFAAGVDRLRRFEQEARTQAALNHPNILTIHDAGVHERAPYLVRELPDGKSLVSLGQDERGVNGVYIQEFVPGKDTTNTRLPLGGFDPENSAESFGISPDGRFITIAAWEQFLSIMVTEDLPSQ